jgi:5-methyltetrahydropteroyltriglutamate--homocysteine methyltransferase
LERSIDRILTTHTGSLPRPAGLLELLAAKDNSNTIDLAELEKQTADATHDVVRKQLGCGIDVVNDGEMGKVAYSTYVRDRLSGFTGPERESGPPPGLLEFPEFAKRMRAEAQAWTMKRPTCDGPIAWKDREAVGKDISRLKAALGDRGSPHDVFMTAASPGVIALFLKNEYYRSDREYLATLADVMKEEYEAIHRAGYILQLDCPDLAIDPSRLGLTTGLKLVDLVEQHVAAINQAVANIPADRIRLHLCWGNYEGPHNHDVPLREIIETVFHANVGAISFEGANPRHEHEWAIFKEVKLPPDKIIIPGVIDSTTNFIEHPELVAQRIVRYVVEVGRENVIASTDCGFATFAGRMPVVPSIAWAKLQVLSEGARIASTQLWAR